MINNFIIRKAEGKDLKKVQQLNHELFLHDAECDPTLHMNWPFEKAGEEYFLSRINEVSGVCYVAEIEGEVIGYVCGAIKSPHTARTITKIVELENILVKEGLRGNNIGEKLCEAIFAWGKLQGAERATVSAFTDNKEAIRFYERIGYAPYDLTLEREL